MQLPKVVISPPFEDNLPPWCYFDSPSSCEERQIIEDSFANTNGGSRVTSAIGGNPKDISLETSATRHGEVARPDIGHRFAGDDTINGCSLGNEGTSLRTESGKQQMRRYMRLFTLVSRVRVLAKPLQWQTGPSIGSGHHERTSDLHRGAISSARSEPSPHGEVSYLRRTLAHPRQNQFEQSVRYPLGRLSGQKNSRTPVVLHTDLWKANSSQTMCVYDSVPSLGSMHFGALQFDSHAFSTRGR
jgi:hypothetical protein